MSALGQKQAFAPQKAMSALPPIATAKADIRNRVERLVMPKQQTDGPLSKGKADTTLCSAHVRL